MTLCELKDKIDTLISQGADPNMPCFLLLGRDPSAPTIVQIWVTLTSVLYRTTPDFLGRHEKCYKAYALSREMEVWQIEHGTKVPD